jgi:dihydrofolate reductase
VGRDLEAAPEGGVLHHPVGGARQCPPGFGGLAEEIERLRAEQGVGDIPIGGATLAAEAAALGLIDEYRARVYPVLVGGGIPFFPQRERRVDLELVENRTFSSRVVYLRYRVAR